MSEDLESLTAAAELGDTAAMSRLGYELREVDPMSSRLWYRKAADAGDIDAIFNLARTVERENPSEAERLYREAGIKGDGQSYTALAFLLEDLGRPANEILDSFKKAAALGEPQAMYCLGKRAR